MKNIFRVLILFTLLILNGCYKENIPSKYKIAISPTGVAYRLNEATGEVCLVADNELIKIQENKEITLIIGESYKAEDNTYFKYLGKGQLQYYETKEQRFNRLKEEIAKQRGK